MLVNTFDPFLSTIIKELPWKSSFEAICGRCGKQCNIKVNTARKAIKNKTALYCSYYCAIEARSDKTFMTDQCGNCNKTVIRKCKEHRKSKSGKIFCNRSCSTTYRNKNKSFGIRRSKLECFLEHQIRAKWSDLLLDCNSKNAIGSELDFYFPELKVAIEINGIFHYEPIYGKDKLAQIKNNDDQKLYTCKSKGIKLYIIDSSSCSDMTKKNKDKFWNIIEQLLSSILTQKTIESSHKIGRATEN